MAKEFDKKYLDLLQYGKDNSEAFGIDVAALLQSFIKGFRNGDVPLDFKSVVLIVQAGSSAYGKKVEHLRRMATSLYAILVKNETQNGDSDLNNGIETARKEHIFPSSIEITPGKNLSCLTRNNTIPKKCNASKKAQKKKPFKVHSFVPVDLLPLEGEEKGDVFHDTKGEPVGHKSDYALNMMEVTASGWMLLSTVSPDLIDVVDAVSKNDIAKKGDCNERDSSDGKDNSDGDYPPSSRYPSSAPTAPNSQESDEGIGTLQLPPSEEADVDSKPTNPGLELDDFEIIKSPTHSIGGDKNPISKYKSDEVPVGDVSSMDGESPQETEPVFNLDAEIRLITEKESTEFRGNIFQNFEQAKMNKRIRIWLKGLRLFLNDINTKQKFDINLYCYCILNTFGNSNRRQTMSFTEICQGKGEWEIHRLFMALLPLASMGNVELREDGKENKEIMVTLLSRRMHHLELEEFGHNSGEH